MDATAIEETLVAAEKAVAEHRPLGPTGFWKAVATVKGEPTLIASFADRIARIDRAGFKDWALLVLPLWLGTVLAVGATMIGLTLVAWAYSLDGFAAAAAFLVGFGILLVSTHGLAHLVVGMSMGMRFTHWFIGTIKQPQPGVKLDYATYLRAPARSRAWMHASGAIVTKIMPFALLGAAIAANLDVWVIVLVIVTGVATVVTDVAWSTSASDWKKFKREMSFAHTEP
ncbi:MAG: hypothetical protein WCA93_03925 [Acidimicrobiia bacterium]